MLFNKVTKEHIEQGIKDFKEKGFPDGFGPSSTYDLIYDGDSYPPKAIMAYANYHASGRTIERYFKGGDKTECFRVLREQGFNIEPKQESMETVNVKREFANWLLSNAPDSYSQYLGNSVNSTVERLDEINNFFSERNIFLVDPDNYNEIIDYLKYKTSKKVRVLNKEFVAYDDHHQSGIPKALLRGANYPRFLEEKFKAKNDINYWVFQGNPKVFDFAASISDNTLSNFTVSAHKDKIKTGDKVIIWLSGENAGCYALAEVTHEPKVVQVSEDDAHWKIEQPTDIKAGIKITHNFDSSPITKAQVLKNAKLKDLKAGLQGTNFSATKEEYEALLRMSNVKRFTWVKTHEEIVSYLAANRDNQEHLIQLLKDAGCDVFNDQEPIDNIVDLDVIDPFTFFCYIYKYGPEKRLEILQNIAKALNFSFPKDELGIPSANAQKVWMFPWKYLRNNNEIEKLWNLFFSAINNSISEEMFQEVLQIKNVGKTKLTEALFYVNPENYFPINGPTKPFLNEELDMNSNFTTFSEYEGILSKIRAKSDKPFYQLSYEAWVWNDNINSKRTFNDILNEIEPELNELGFHFKKKYKRYVWLSDKANVIGEKEAHYELVHKKNEIILELHFEDKSNNRTFKNSLGKLGRELEWFNWYDGESIRYKRFFINDKNLETKIIDGIVEMDELIGEKIRSIITKVNSSNKKENSMALNKILYGPPGTGKTYALKQKYFPLYTTKETSITAEKNFENIIKERSWWEVIAVALLQLGTSKVKDIYDHKWVRKKAEMSNSKTVKPTIWGQLQSHTVESCEYVNVKSKQQPLIFNKTEDSAWEVQKEEIENQIPELYEIIKNVEDFQPNPDKTIGRYRFVTFHQSFSYEDFIEGIKPIMPENGEVSEDLGYKIEDGVFKDICKDAELDPNNRYAIFIDEINRGNVSAIFGELITLIEIDKRNGAANEMSITLPYSKKQFSVPANLDIYGTMNTADRSVEALDTALRRRFEFVEMMPDLNIISNEKVEDVLLSEILKVINQRIELLIDRDHTIGHSYFVNIITKKGLASAFNNKIVPLLQEYFYGDYGKIGLVLGKGFVEKQKNDSVEFAHFDYENANDFKIPSFILKPVTENTVMEAVKLLLGNIDD